MFEEYKAFFETLNSTALSVWSDPLRQKIIDAFLPEKNGHSKRWMDAWQRLPKVSTTGINIDSPTLSIGSPEELLPEQISTLRETLMDYHPWRKGPFNYFGIPIETEWRSDWKWDRIKPHIKSLENGIILDIGCGSGYHCWRMLAHNPKLVMGIDPFMAFVWQYLVANRYIQDPRFATIPVGIDDLPQQPACFSTIFSMGVLYHRKDPIAHLNHIKNLLRNKGELVLETLVIEGDEQTVLVPEGRYAKMRNVWFIPSKKAMLLWLRKSGFRNVRMVHECQTTTNEQKQTEWMTFESLKDFLNPQNSSQTVEGYPAPQRAFFVADKN